ncbi:hypothetical protein ACOZ38_29465 [Sphaerisporangium viridialbum]|uniref:hypothetical protein n=1 Tax=Sphaerisporangium viridialbum TaxID=46189 RepID=UPI003C75724F
MIAAVKRLNRHEGRLLIAATPSDIMRSFERHNLVQQLELRDSVDQAVRELEGL